MRSPVGIDFTEYAVRNLLARGFNFAEPEEFDSHTAFRFPLKSDDSGFCGFEIHVVQQERKYLQVFAREHFFPYVSTTAIAAQPVLQPNGVEAFCRVLTYESLGETPLGRYLVLRKGFATPALLLRCEDLAVFEKRASPDMFFEFEQHRAALIHLGPSCFDLVVIQSNASEQSVI